MKGFENDFSRMALGSKDNYVENLTISNSIKGILHMSFDLEKSELRAVENQWRKALQHFPGTLALPKFGM